MHPHDIRAAMQGPPDYEDDTRAAAFWMLDSFANGRLWVGRFTGRSPWERHPEGDELLHTLAGEVEITVLLDDGEERATISAGSLFVVPRGRWHRLLSRDEVTMTGATLGPTEHADGEDPRVHGERRSSP